MDKGFIENASRWESDFDVECYYGGSTARFTSDLPYSTKNRIRVNAF